MEVLPCIFGHFYFYFTGDTLVNTRANAEADPLPRIDSGIAPKATRMTHKLDDDAARSALEAALRDHTGEFGSFFLFRFYGLEISYPEQTSVVRLPVRSHLFNPQGSLHGGVIAFALDVSMGHLLKHTYGVPGVTMEMKTQYFAPVRGPIATCEARFLHMGKGTCFIESRMTDSDGTLAAAATSTWRVLRPTQTPTS